MAELRSEPSTNPRSEEEGLVRDMKIEALHEAQARLAQKKLEEQKQDMMVVFELLRAAMVRLEKAMKRRVR